MNYRLKLTLRQDIDGEITAKNDNPIEMNRSDPIDSESETDSESEADKLDLKVELLL